MTEAINVRVDIHKHLYTHAVSVVSETILSVYLHFVVSLTKCDHYVSLTHYVFVSHCLPSISHSQWSQSPSCLTIGIFSLYPVP